MSPRERDVFKAKMFAFDAMRLSSPTIDDSEIRISRVVDVAGRTIFLLMNAVDRTDGRRKGYCVVLTVSDDDGHFNINERFGVVECGDPVTEAEVRITKSVNHWPGAEWPLGRELQ